MGEGSAQGAPNTTIVRAFRLPGLLTWIAAPIPHAAQVGGEVSYPPSSQAAHRQL